MKTQVELKPAWSEPLKDALTAARGDESQRELAARSNVSDRTISMIELGNLKKPPKAKTLIRLAIATGRKAEDWLKLVGLPVRPADIERERKLVGIRAVWSELEPPEVIKQDVMSRVNEQYVPADKLREEFEKKIRDHVSEFVSNLKSQYEPAAILRSGMSDLEKLIHTMQLRIDQLASRVETLARELDELWLSARGSSRSSREEKQRRK